MHDTPKQSDPLRISVAISRTILLIFVSVMALFTLTLFFAQNFDISFRVFALSSSLMGISVSGLIIGIVIHRQRQCTYVNDWGTLGILLTLSIGSASLALFTYRPDSDDQLYVPNVVYYRQHPDESMNYDIHFIAFKDGKSVKSLTWGTSIAFEYAQSALAYTLGLDFLEMYYYVFAALSGALIPLAFFFMTAQFSKEASDALFATVLISAALLILNDTHRTYGNFAFPRIVQGKAVMLTIGLPTFISFSFSYFSQVSRQGWFALFVTSTASLGMTTSTIPVLSAQAVVVLFGALVAGIVRWNQYRVWFSYLISLISLPLFALFLVTQSNLDLGMDSVVNKGYPRDFMGHLEFWHADGFPRTIFAWVVVFVICLVILPRRQKRLIFGWLLAAGTLFLNPLVAEALIRYVTTPNIYWRMFYIMPFTLGIGLCGIWFSDWIASKPIPLRTLVPMALVTLLLAMGVYNYQQDNVISSSPHYKIGGQIVKQAVAETIISNTPEGPMLAPKEVSLAIPLLRSASPQIAHRANAMYLWMGHLDYTAGYIQSRLNAAEYVGGNLDFESDFLLLLNQNIIEVLVMTPEIHAILRADGILAAHGFNDYHDLGNYTVTWISP